MSSGNITLITSLLNRAADDLRDGWATLVAIALRMERDKPIDDVAKAIAKRGHCGEESVKRKLLAIQYSHYHIGYTEAQILSAGQEVILSKCQKERRAEKFNENVWLRYKVTGSTRELFNNQMIRVARVCDFHTSEEVFFWLIAQLQTLTEYELKHSVGEGHPRP